MDTSTPEGREKRKFELIYKPKIAYFTKKYRETGEKKYLHFLSNLGVDVDYLESDLEGSPKGGYNE